MSQIDSGIAASIISGMTGTNSRNINGITKISQVTPEVTWFLRNLGFSNYYIIKIFDLVGDAAIGLTEDDPYWLLDEFPHMGFKKADEVAARLGIPADSELRIRAAVEYVLAFYISEGHTYAEYREFCLKCGEYLGVASERIDDVLEDLAYLGKLQVAFLSGQKVIYFYKYYRAECKTAGKLAILADPECGLPPIIANPDAMIRKSEEQMGITLSHEQKSAVISAIASGVSVITGGPGTGKTTIINTIINILKESGHSVKVCAPTGRAAKRVMETSGHYAQTIHRLLDYYPDEETGYMKFGKNHDEPVEANCVIVDEASMIDVLLMEALTDALKPGTRLILVGDADQLPSVGAGNVLADIINSEYFNTFKLNEIFRQSAQSGIVVNAHRINKGTYPEFDMVISAGTEISRELFRGEHEAFSEGFEPELILVEQDKQQDILDTIKKIARCFDPADVQVLSPVKKGIVGVSALNSELQNIMNPLKEQSEEAELKFGNNTFRAGDRVMQIRNDYQLEFRSFIDSAMAVAQDPLVSFSKEEIASGEPVRKGKGVFNGEIGRVESVDVDEKTVTVVFDEERWVVYDYVHLDELELAYAITVHKSQGGEFPVVIIPMTWFPPMLATRSLIYTGMTRARKKAVIVGKRDYLDAMVDNNTSRSRNSGLGIRIINLYQPGV